MKNARVRIPGSPGRIFTPRRRGDSFIFAGGSVGPGSLETFRGAASGIGATVGTSIYIYIYIYISSNYLPRPVAPAFLPRLWVVFLRRSRAKPPFPARMHNSIEKVRPHVAKVTCFIEPFEVSSDPPDLLQQYRRWCSDPLQIPGGSVIGFPYMYITTTI